MAGAPAAGREGEMREPGGANTAPTPRFSGPAAAGQHPHPRLGREVAPCRHHPDPADDLGAIGGRGSGVLSEGRMSTEAERGNDGAGGANPGESGDSAHEYLMDGLTLRLSA